MNAAADHPVLGKWWIVEADLWDRDYLDLEYSPTMVFFTWAGFDEIDEVTGSGSAELLDDGSIEIEFAYNLGDETILKTNRQISSPAC